MIPKPRIVTGLIIAGVSSSGSSSAPVAMANASASSIEMLEALDASVTVAIDGVSSSATIRLPEGVNIDGRTYIEMFTIQGSAGIFRTRSPQTGYGLTDTNLQLEHAINELGDFIITARIQRKMSLKAAMKEIFKHYTNKSLLWRLGTVQTPVDPDNDEDSSEECILDVNYDNCLDAVMSVMEQYPYMQLSFDFSSRPWKLNVINKTTEVTAEGRLSRNVKSAKVTRDDSELFTRAYMVGYNKNVDANGYGCCTSKWASGKYGIIETVITGANDTAEIAERTIKNFLHTHKKPRFSITVDGIELSKETGETLDRLTIGKMMRLAIPKYNTTVSKHITKLIFHSVYKNPNSVTVSLEDEPDKVIKYIKAAQKKANSVGKKAISKMSVKGNVLTLTQGDGTELNFSKAVTLEEKWSGGLYYVNAWQSNVDSDGKSTRTLVGIESTRLDGIELNGSVSDISLVGNYTLDVPLRVKADGAQTGYSTSVRINGEKAYNKGKTDVTLDDPKWSSSSASGNSNTVSVSTKGRNPTLTKSVQLYLTRGEWSSGKRYVYINHTNSTEATRVARIEIDASLLDPTWSSSSASSNSNTVTVTSLTGQSKSVQLYLSRGDWASGKRYVYINHTNTSESTRVARIEIDASLSDPVWSTTPSSGVTGNSNKVTVSSATGESKSVRIYLNSGDWSSGSKYVYATQSDSSAGNRVARLEVEIPNATLNSSISTTSTPPTGSISIGSISLSGSTAGTYKTASIKAGGKVFTIHFGVYA